MSKEEDNHKLEAVKELIFGQNMKEYDSKFTKLEALITKKNEDHKKSLSDSTQKIKEIIQQQNKELISKINKLEKLLAEKTSELHQNKTDRATLSQLLHEIADKLNA